MGSKCSVHTRCDDSLSQELYIEGNPLEDVPATVLAMACLRGRGQGDHAFLQQRAKYGS